MSEELSLPPHWIRTSLKNLSHVLDSQRIPVNNAERATRLASSPSRFPYYGATGQVGEIDDYLFDGEAVLLGEDGAPFLERHRKKAYLVAGKFWVNNHAHILRPRSGVSCSFLCHQLNAISYESYVSGTTRLKLTQAAMNDIQLAVAPQEEQKQIASKIDELFSSIDEGERALERVRKLVERYRQSVLKAAVTGELTRAWREQHAGELESGEALLTRILEARRQAWEQSELARFKISKTKMTGAWQKKYKEREIANAELAYEVPSGWTLAGLDQLAASLDRAIQSGPFGSNLLHSEFRVSGKLVIGIDNVREGWFSLGSQHRISNEKFLELEKYVARPGDFLITIMATIGRTCIVPANLEPSIISKHVYRFTLDHDVVLPEFVNICVLGHPAVRNAIFGSTQGQTRPGLNKSILVAIPFPLPSLAEQQIICDTVPRLLSQIGPLQAAIADQTREAQALRQAILRAAFSGQLVPQDPTDEPASVLLERIAAERAAAPKRTSAKQPRTKKAKAKA